MPRGTGRSQRGRTESGRKSRFSETQRVDIFGEDVASSEPARRPGSSLAPCCSRRSKYASSSVSERKGMQELEVRRGKRSLSSRRGCPAVWLSQTAWCQLKKHGLEHAGTARGSRGPRPCRRRWYRAACSTPCCKPSASSARRTVEPGLSVTFFLLEALLAHLKRDAVMNRGETRLSFGAYRTARGAAASSSGRSRTCAIVTRASPATCSAPPRSSTRCYTTRCSAASGYASRGVPGARSMRRG